MGKALLEQINFKDYCEAKNIRVVSGVLPSKEYISELSLDNSNNIYLWGKNFNYTISTNNEEDQIYMNSNLSGICKQLTLLQSTDLINKHIVNYHYVTNLHTAFSNCFNLKGTPISAKRIRSMYGTYYNCTNLNGSLYINANVNNMIGTFYNCGNIIGPAKCNDNVICMKRAYYNCVNLIGAPACGEKVKSLEDAYYNCYLLEGNPANCNTTFITTNAYYNCPNLYGDFYWVNSNSHKAFGVNMVNMFYNRNINNILNIYVKGGCILNALVNYGDTYGDIYGLHTQMIWDNIDYTDNYIERKNYEYNTNIREIINEPGEILWLESYYSTMIIPSQISDVNINFRNGNGRINIRYCEGFIRTYTTGGNAWQSDNIKTYSYYKNDLIEGLNILFNYSIYRINLLCYRNYWEDKRIAYIGLNNFSLSFDFNIKYGQEYLDLFYHNLKMLQDKNNNFNNNLINHQPFGHDGLVMSTNRNILLNNWFFKYHEYGSLINLYKPRDSFSLGLNFTNPKLMAAMNCSNYSLDYVKYTRNHYLDARIITLSNYNLNRDMAIKIKNEILSNLQISESFYGDTTIQIVNGPAIVSGHNVFIHYNEDIVNNLQIPFGNYPWCTGVGSNISIAPNDAICLFYRNYFDYKGSDVEIPPLRLNNCSEWDNLTNYYVNIMNNGNDWWVHQFVIRDAFTYTAIPIENLQLDFGLIPPYHNFQFVTAYYNYGLYTGCWNIWGNLSSYYPNIDYDLNFYTYMTVNNTFGNFNNIYTPLCNLVQIFSECHHIVNLPSLKENTKISPQWTTFKISDCSNLIDFYQMNSLMFSGYHMTSGNENTITGLTLGYNVINCNNLISIHTPKTIVLDNNIEQSINTSRKYQIEFNISIINCDNFRYIDNQELQVINSSLCHLNDIYYIYNIANCFNFNINTIYNAEQYQLIFYNLSSLTSLNLFLNDYMKERFDKSLFHIYNCNNFQRINVVDCGLPSAGRTAGISNTGFSYCYNLTDIYFTDTYACHLTIINCMNIKNIVINNVGNHVILDIRNSINENNPPNVIIQGSLINISTNKVSDNHYWIEFLYN